MKHWIPTGGTSSRSEKMTITHDYQAAAREQAQRHAEQQRQTEKMVREQQQQQERRFQQERQAQERWEAERRQQEAEFHRREQERLDRAAHERAEQQRAEQQRAADERAARERNGGGNNNGGGSGGNGGNGNGHGFPNGYDRDVVNTVDQSRKITSLPTDPLNVAAKVAYEQQNPGKTHIPPYQPQDYAHRGYSNPNPDPNASLLRFHDKRAEPEGRWNASLDEMKRRVNQLEFKAATVDSTHRGYQASSVVQDYLALSHKPAYFSMANLNGRPTGVEISRTVTGNQQVYVNDSESMNYSGTSYINNFFKFLRS